jgi:N-acetyl-anhydromuramyl-L-alanine amidase AmpD
MMRKINKIIIHCSATPNGRFHDVPDIRRWHQQNGWADIGYHYVIRTDGVTEIGREDSVVGAHAYGYNESSIGVCMIGNDKYNGVQWHRLRELVAQLVTKYPDAKVIGHNEISHKSCPGFDVQEWFKGEFS